MTTAVKRDVTKGFAAREIGSSWARRVKHHLLAHRTEQQPFPQRNVAQACLTRREPQRVHRRVRPVDTDHDDSHVHLLFSFGLLSFGLTRSV